MNLAVPVAYRASKIPSSISLASRIASSGSCGAAARSASATVASAWANTSCSALAVTLLSKRLRPVSLVLVVAPQPIFRARIGTVCYTVSLAIVVAINPPLLFKTDASSAILQVSSISRLRKGSLELQMTQQRIIKQILCRTSQGKIMVRLVF